ncbi:MAG: AMP-binding protein [Nitrospirae bacterium]|nr:AMP-binding protein [Nitrospirota bacterium]
MQGEFVWKPGDDYIKRSRLKRFMERHRIKDFNELILRSTDDIEWFWNAVMEDLNIEFYRPYDKVVDLSGGIQFPTWCVNGRMNIIHNMLDKYIDTPMQNRVAVRYESEDGTVTLISYRDLWMEVNRMANALRKLGFKKGDVIALYMPMTPQVVIAFCAIIKIGGIVLPLFSGYGKDALSVRINDTTAAGVVTCDGSVRRGKKFLMKPVLDEAIKETPSVRKVIVFRNTGEKVSLNERDVFWDEILKGESHIADAERTNAEDTLMLIYTSGTTGKPKGAVHTHCGFPLKSAQDMAHGMDIQQFDTMFWITDMGWMMGPWEVFGTLILGATMMLYDGSPDYPDMGRIWSVIERNGVTCLGISPTLVRMLMANGTGPIERYDLSSLRIFGSTGEPWDRESWMWLFKEAGKEKIPIINYSGGTEVSGGILLGNVLTPLKPTAFSGPAPGMAVDIVDDNGDSIRDAVGGLVVKKPWIGMTRGFYKDPERYIKTYWSRFPDVWVHGDFALVDEDNLWYILGRSDDTIKVAGKRVGPAEIESIVMEHPSIMESAAIGIPDPLKGQAIVVFCVLRPDKEKTKEVEDEMKKLIGERVGKPFMPKAVYLVNDLPKTRNAKIMRRVIKNAYLGENTGDLSALLNPEAVEEIMAIGTKKRET